MSGREPTNPLMQLHRAFNDRDAERVRALLDDNVIWHIPGDHPMAGTYKGVDQVWSNFFGPLLSGPDARVEHHASLMHPDHEHVAVLIDVVRDFGDGERHIRGIEVAQISDGKITQRWAFDEDQEEVDRLMNAAISGSSVQS